LAFGDTWFGAAASFCWRFGPYLQRAVVGRLARHRPSAIPPGGLAAIPRPLLLGLARECNLGTRNDRRIFDDPRAFGVCSRRLMSSPLKSSCSPAGCDRPGPSCAGCGEALHTDLRAMDGSLQKTPWRDSASHYPVRFAACEPPKWASSSGPIDEEPFPVTSSACSR